MNLETLLIGKSLNEVKKILGTKMETINLDEVNNNYFAYYATEKAKENTRTTCVLHFNDEGILESIIASYNP